MSGHLAITPGFEPPPAQPAPAAAPVLQTGAARATSHKAAGQAKASSAFANLIQELAHEAALRSPAATSPKTAPQDVQQAPQQVAASAPAPPAIEFPPLSGKDDKGDGRASLAQSTPDQSTVESTPDAPVKDAEKPGLESPALLQDARRSSKSDASKPQKISTPTVVDAAFLTPVVPPMSLKLPSFITHPGEGAGDGIHMSGDDLRTTSTANPSLEQTLDMRPAPALELKIRAQDQPAPEQPAAPTSKPAPADQQTDTELPSTVTSGAQPRAEQIVHAFASAPGPAAIESAPAPPAPMSMIAVPPAPVNPPQPINTNASSAPPPQAPAAHLADEPVSRQPEQHAQPLRSLSLEFAPDGAQDVRVRVAEHAGDVHISLHSTDPALSGRLSDGVHELVGTLANAGYDAQAWTQGQSRQNHSEQNQAPPDDPRRNRRGNSAGAGTDDFDAILQQPSRIKP